MGNSAKQFIFDNLVHIIGCKKKGSKTTWKINSFKIISSVDIDICFPCSSPTTIFLALIVLCQNLCLFIVGQCGRYIKLSREKLTNNWHVAECFAVVVSGLANDDEIFDLASCTGYTRFISSDFQPCKGYSAENRSHLGIARWTEIVETNANSFSMLFLPIEFQ